MTDEPLSMPSLDLDSSPGPDPAATPAVDRRRAATGAWLLFLGAIPAGLLALAAIAEGIRQLSQARGGEGAAAGLAGLLAILMLAVGVLFLGMLILSRLRFPLLHGCGSILALLFGVALFAFLGFGDTSPNSAPVPWLLWVIGPAFILAGLTGWVGWRLRRG